VAFHAGQAWIQTPQKSLYRNREVIAAAIREKQPEMFGHRRAFAIDGGPAFLESPMRPYDSLKDVQISDTQLSVGPRRVALWTFTLRNANDRVAYRDVLYQTHYRDEQGQVVDQRYDFIKEIFQPGAVARLEVNDGLVARPFVTATIQVLGAEGLLPIK
jgi:hypothetical protein